VISASRSNRIAIDGRLASCSPIDGRCGRCPAVAVQFVESHSGFLREWLDVSSLYLALLFNVANTDGFDILPLVVEDLHVINLGQVKTKEVIFLCEIFAG
jgi:hypothetical protein